MVFSSCGHQTVCRTPRVNRLAQNLSLLVTRCLIFKQYFILFFLWLPKQVLFELYLSLHLVIYGCFSASSSPNFHDG